MALLTVQQPAIDGTAPTSNVASAGGDTFAPVGDSATFVRFTNANVSTPRTVTLADATSSEPAGANAWDPNVDIAVPASSSRVIAIRDNDRFKSSGVISMTYSSEADLTIELYGG